MLIVLITLLGAALRFVGIGHQGFWYDEAYTSFLLRYSPGHMLGLLPQLESTPPLYYCVAWVWVRVFGNDPAGLKSLSALCGTLAIPVAYAAARKLLADRRAAVIAALLIACNPLLIWYSQEARAYSMLVLMSTLTLLAFAYARVRPRPFTLAAWALASALALTTHYYAVLVIAPEGAWLLYERRDVRAVKFALVAVILVGLALIPLLISQNRTGNDDWIGMQSLGTRLAQVLPLFLLGPETHLRVIVKYVAYAAVLVGLAAFVWCAPLGAPWHDRWRRSRGALPAGHEQAGHERKGALLAGGIALVGFLIATTVGEGTLLGRNLLPIVIPLALFLAAGLGSSRARVAGVSATLALCAVGVFAAVSVATDYNYERPNWQPLATALGPWQPSGARAHDARLVIVQNNPGLLPLGLYMPGLRFLKARSVYNLTTIDLVAVAHHRDPGSFCWWGSACNLVPARLDRRFRPAGFRVARRFSVEQFRVLELVATRPQTLSVTALPSADKRELIDSIRAGRGKLADGYLIQQS